MDLDNAALPRSPPASTRPTCCNVVYSQVARFTQDHPVTALHPIPFHPMSWRVIVRFSLNDDKNSQLRNKLEKALQTCGINRTKTATYESASVDQQQAAHVLANLLTTLGEASLSADGDSPSLSHLWIYVDRVDDANSSGPDLLD
jgi:hypothetical protein